LDLIPWLGQEAKTTKQSVYYMNTNEPLNLTALAGEGWILVDQRPARTDFQ